MTRRRVADVPFAGFNRRQVFEVVGGALPSLTVSQLLAAASTRSAVAGTRSRVKSCILLFYYGGPSHLDTWDLKPHAPAEVRGDFQPIATRIPGLQISEHLPHCAGIVDKLAVVRSMHHSMRNHNAAAVEALCGRMPAKGDLELLADDANSFPCYGAALSKLAPNARGLPTHVALPHVMYNVVVLPGQNAGFLGPAYNPFQVTRDPNDPAFRVDELQLPADTTATRLNARQTLLAAIGSQDRLSPPSSGSLTPDQERAFALLQSDAVRRAFDLRGESEAVRDRYGRTKLGQSLILARRLVEAGVRVVNVHDKVRNSQLANWDSHQNNAQRLRDDLLPPADRAFSALIEDLEQRGLLDSTLVVALGEFGRTPIINKNGGRDHWPDCFSVLLAGGGVSAGAVYGASDKIGAYPQTDPVTPGDLAATIFWRFGLDPESELRDMLGRPHRLATGQPLTKLFGIT